MHLSRIPLAFAFASLVATVGTAQAQSEPRAAATPRPHILLVLADDLGRGDVGFLGGPFPTPTLDALAAEGARLDAFYVLPICAPTRAALLTGRYPIRYGLQDGAATLPASERTLAEALAEVGYRTAIVGKWHLGHDSFESLPTHRGFHHQYGFYDGAVSYYGHGLAMTGRDWYRNDRPLYEEGYATDLLADEAVRIVEAHDPGTPLFLYLPFNAPHTPLRAPPECVARLAEGGAPPADLNRRVYGAMVSCMDAALARVLDAFERRGMRENTLVIFASDNGGVPQWTDSGGLRGGKWTLYEGGVRAVALASWPGVIEAASSVEAPMHAVDLFPTLVGLAGGTVAPDLPLDGVDVWPAITGGAASERLLLLNAGAGWAALRRGPWKLIERRARAGVAPELYDLSRDPGESENLAEREPRILADLGSSLRAFVAEAAPAQRRVGKHGESGELLYVSEGNRVRRVDLDTLDTLPLLQDVWVESAKDAPANGRDLNGSVCVAPDGTGRLVAGEDTGQPNPPAGWGVLTREGTQVGKLTPTSHARVPEPHGCAFDAEGRLFTTEVGDPGLWEANGQLLLWFPPFDRFPGPSGAYPDTNAHSDDYCVIARDIGTAGAVAVDAAGRVYVASAGRLSIRRFLPPFPTSADAAGGCGRRDGLGSPLADWVHEEVFARGLATFSGLAITPDGRLFASSVATGRIYEYDLEGNRVRTILAPPESLPPFSTGHPMGLALDRRGQLYYADLDLVFGLSGVGPGPDGKVWRIRFEGNEPRPPEIVLEGLAFPDGLGVVRGNLQPRSYREPLALPPSVSELPSSNANTASAAKKR